jgi:hypothetical protein
MSRYFPHTPYAEDQPLSRTILTTHVMTRALTTGTIIGSGIYTIQELLRAFRSKPPPSSKSSSAIIPLSRSQRFLRVTGTSSLVTIGIMSVLLPLRMYSREEIEWKDRAWRLMGNKGQLETDDFTYAAMAAGLAAAVVRRPAAGVVGVVGAVGASSALGMLGYMGWRYGVRGGKFSEDEAMLTRAGKSL